MPHPAAQHPTTPARHPWRGRLVVLTGLLLVALNLRVAIASVSPVLDVIRAEVALSAAQAGLLGTVPVASFAAFGSIAPLVARRLGLEPTLMAAMLLSAVGEVVRATTTTAAGFLGWSVIALAGMGMGNVLLPPLVKRYFPDRIGAVTAAYSVAMSFSTAVPPLLAVPSTQQLGWRVSIAVWAAVGVVAVVPWLVVIGRSAAARAGLREVLRRSPQDTPALASRHRASGRVWRSPLAWALALAFAMNSLNSYVVFAWFPQLLLDAGVDAARAGGWLSYVAVLGLVPALVAPPLAVRLRNPFVLALGFVACFLVGGTGLLLDPAGATVVWASLVGVGLGTFPLLLALINLRTRTSAGATTLSGFTQGVGYTLSGVGPVLVGVLYGATGGWAAPSVVLATSSVVLLVAAALACRPVMLEDTWVRGPGRGLDTLSA